MHAGPLLAVPRPAAHTRWPGRALQAMLTTRKGNKRFAFYDLSMTLDWEATPAAPAEAGADASAGAAAAAEALAGASLECAAGGEAQPASSEGDAGADAGATGKEAAAAGAAGSKEQGLVVSGTLDIKEFGSVSRGGCSNVVRVAAAVHPQPASCCGYGCVRRAAAAAAPHAACALQRAGMTARQQATKRAPLVHLFDLFVSCRAATMRM